MIGYLEPLDEFDMEEANAAGKKVIFVNQIVGASIPPNFVPAIEKVLRAFFFFFFVFVVFSLL